MPKLLTKSKYMNGLESYNLLWRAVNDPDSIPKPDEKAQARFDFGKLIEDYAHHIYPNSINLSEYGFIENIDKTKELMNSDKILFEAGFMTNRLYTRSDIIIPNKDTNSYEIIEIKSGTRIKDEHINDLAFQRYVLTKSGYKVDKCCVMNINNKYVKDGDIKPELLLKLTDVTQDVDKASEGIEERVNEMISIIDQKECPEITIKDLSTIKFATFLYDEFLSEYPENNVFDLYDCKMKKKCALWTKGYRLIKDIPDEELDSKQIIQKKTIIEGKPHINSSAIKEFIDSLEYPIYHLDFESINGGVPVIDGTKPYQQIPFQYSLHIENEDGSIVHKEFIHSEQSDPRIEFGKSLINDLGKKGTIFAYHDTYEKTRLREIKKKYAEFESDFNKIIDRFKDLKKPFSSFNFYDPRQDGSCSIKNVLPIFSDLRHSNLNISSGEDAAAVYLSLIYGNNITEPEKVKKDLLEYCKLDTYSMVILLDGLRKCIS